MFNQQCHIELNPEQLETSAEEEAIWQFSQFM